MKRRSLNLMTALLALMVLATMPFAWMSQHLEYQPRKPLLNGLAIAPDGRRAYVSESVTGTISALSIDKGIETARFSIDGTPGGMAFNADGTRAYITARRGDGNSSLVVIDTARDAAISAFPIPDCAAGQLALIAGGTALALASVNETEVCTASLELASGTVSGLTRHLEGDSFYHAMFTPDAKQFLVGACRTCDHHGMFYGLAKLSLVSLPVDRTQPASSSTEPKMGHQIFDVSSDGKLLAFSKEGYYDEPVFAALLDRTSGKAVASIPLGRQMPGIRVQFSPDNKTLHTVNSSHPPVLSMHDIAGKKAIASLTLPPDRTVILMRATAKHLLLVNTDASAPPRDDLSGDVTIVDLRTHRIAAIIPVAAPTGVAIKLRAWQVARWIRERNPWAAELPQRR